MAKGERKEVQSSLKSDIARRRQEEDAFVASREAERAEARQRSAGLLSEAERGFRGLTETGGFAPEQLSYLRGVGAGHVATGGYDQPELAEARAGYRTLTTGGGVTPAEEGAMIRRATRGVTSVYDVLGAEAARRRAITGGYGGGGDISQMARQVGQKSAEAATDVGAEIARMRQVGRLEGVRGLAGLTSEEATGRRAALEGYRGLETEVAGGVRAGVSGLGALYGMSQDEAVNLGRDILQRIQLGQQVSEADMQMLTELSKQPGIFDNIIRAIGAGAGVASAFIPGLGAVKKAAGNV